MRIEEESNRNNDSLRQLSKAQSEIQLWKSKYETEALGRIDELEGSCAKLGSKVTESEESIDCLNSKIATCEKLTTKESELVHQHLDDWQESW